MKLSAGFRAAMVEADPVAEDGEPAGALPLVLVVDDERAVADSLTEQLRRRFRVLAATSGREALELLESHDVTVLVSDQRMPGMTGDELLKQARAISPDTVRVLLTGYSDLEAVIRSVNEGQIYFYMTKPWRAGELDAVVDNAVRHGLGGRERRDLIEQLRRLNAELEERVAARTLELQERAQRLEEANETISKIARTDPLTGIANRRRLDEVLASEAARAKRTGQTIGFVLVDLDKFKSVNDDLGHPMGDRVLVEAARTFEALVRPYDLVARFGGEEFACVLPSTMPEQACLVAERLRSGLAARAIQGMPRAVTASFGVASLRPGDEPADALARADGALYRAKLAGRDRVALEEPPAQEPR